MDQESRTKLTPAEWDIMQTVWRLAPPVTVRDVLEKRFPAGEKAYTTVQTVMNTLVRKSVLTRRKIGLVGFYTPAASRDDAVRSETTRLVDGLFDGSVPALTSSLLSLDGVDLDDLAEIKRLLARRERELKGKS